MPGVVQSVIIPKSEFTFLQAVRWLIVNDYKTTFEGKRVHVTKNNWRFRQRAPVSNNRYITHILPNKIKIVLMYSPKK